jgi:L-threonylcarbamoyladenylate synthase
MSARQPAAPSRSSRPRRARTYAGTPRNLATLARVLRRGGLVAAPTETVYGLAANALDPVACEKIFIAKARPQTDPLIVHIDSLADLSRLAYVNTPALMLAEKFWPGPLTLVLPKTDVVPAIVSAGLPSVAVRMPAHPLFRRLLRLAGVPLAAPSANPFGYVSPTTAQHVREGLGDRIGHILDGGPCTVGLESTIVDLRDPRHPRLLRPGAISRAQLEETLGCPVTAPRRQKKPATVAQVAPGLLTRHYSPHTPVRLHATLPLATAAASDHSQAWVFLAKPALPARSAAKNIFWLDAQGDLARVAHRLFAVLRQLDHAGFARIHVELAPGHAGLADAINDRLRRAAAR